jgi:hypothetical protein
VLKKGEVFFEIGNGGTPTTYASSAAVATGKSFGKIKMGNGTNTYQTLGYFIDVDTTVVAWTDPYPNNATSAAQGSQLYANLNAINTSANVKTIFNNIKSLLYKMATQVTKLNNDLKGINNNLTNVNNKLSVSTVSVTNGTNRTLIVNNVKKIGNVCYVNIAFDAGPTGYNIDWGLARFDGISANGRAYLIGYITHPNGSDFTVRQLYVENRDNVLKLAESQLTSGYLMIVQGCFVTN